MVTAGLRAPQLDNTANQFMGLLSKNKIISLVKWKHEDDVEKPSATLTDLLQLTHQSEQYISSTLRCTILQGQCYNTIYLRFVWREPANCITLISQAVFIQVITMPGTVVKRSICHLNSNDFSIFPWGRTNLSRAQIVLKPTEKIKSYPLNKPTVKKVSSNSQQYKTQPCS